MQFVFYLDMSVILFSVVLIIQNVVVVVVVVVGVRLCRGTIERQFGITYKKELENRLCHNIFGNSVTHKLVLIDRLKPLNIGSNHRKT